MVNKPFIIQSANLTHKEIFWDCEKREITLERAIRAAENMIASGEQFGFRGVFAYRVIDDATGEELWKS